MKTIFLLLFLASPLLAGEDEDFAFEMAMARQRLHKKEPVEQLPSPPKAIQSWLAQPLNVGHCPCQGTGGCHCQPHSLCAGGQCKNHNPLLQTKTASDNVNPYIDNPHYPWPAQVLTQTQQCPDGNCPQGSAGGRQLRRIFRR